MREWLKDHALELASLVVAVVGVKGLTDFWARLREMFSSYSTGALFSCGLAAAAAAIVATYFARSGYRRRTAAKDTEIASLEAELAGRPTQEELDELRERLDVIESRGHRVAETIGQLPDGQKAALWYAYSLKGDPVSERCGGLSGELEALAERDLLTRVRVDGSQLKHYVIGPDANAAISGDEGLLGQLELARDDFSAHRAQLRRDSLFDVFRGLTPYERIAVVGLFDRPGHEGLSPDITSVLRKGTVSLGKLVALDEFRPNSNMVHLADGVAQMLGEHPDYVTEVRAAAREEDRLRASSEIDGDPSSLLRHLDLRGMRALARLLDGDLALEDYGEGDLDALYDYGLVAERDARDGGTLLELRPDIRDHFSSDAGDEELRMTIAELEKAESD